jgi:hypothetical protein
MTTRVPVALKAHVGSDLNDAASALEHAGTVLHEGIADAGIKKLIVEVDEMAGRLRQINMAPLPVEAIAHVDARLVADANRIEGEKGPIAFYGVDARELSREALIGALMVMMENMVQQHVCPDPAAYKISPSSS